jgi:ribosomal protein L7/L12
MSEPLPPDVVAAMNASNKVEAIRLLRDHTGLGLAEAKNAVESGYVKAKPQDVRTLPNQLPAEALTALQQGHQIEAIRIVREKFGIDLKAAKDVVDTFVGGRRDDVSAAPTRRLAPGEVPAGQHRIAVAFLVILVAALGAWWAFKHA